MRARRDAAGAVAWVDRASGYADLATDLAAGRVVRGSRGTPLTLAHAAHAKAHARRSAGDADPGAWKAAVGAYLQIGALPSVAWTTFRLAEADLVAGDRVAARDSLSEARATALAIGDVALVAAIDGLGRRGRLDLDEREAALLASAVVPAAPPSNPWNLSKRESEVLALVAEGLTNRAIAGRLFISEKTSSSHVTHILDKLGVSSRTEAALAAARAGVLAETSPPTSTEAPADSLGIDRTRG
jgi:DNA-binding CsgD family transcriptional regulator